MRVEPPELKKLPLLPLPLSSDDVVVVEEGVADVVLDDDMATVVVPSPSDSRSSGVVGNRERGCDERR